MTDLTSTDTTRRNLLAHAPGGAYAVQPWVTISSDGSVCAVLTDNEDGTTTVYAVPGGIRQLAAATPAEPITDPSVTAWQLRQALDYAGTELLKAKAALEREYNERIGDRTGYEKTRARMRAHLIGAYRNDDFSRDALDGFLEAFGFAPYEPRVKVTFALTGSFEVYADDPEEASDAKEYLLAAVRDMPLLVTDSEHLVATIQDTELVDLDA